MITVIGAGLAGCEAAWQVASRGIPVTLIEQKPAFRSPAHHSDDFCELVCSNSLRGDRLENAAGLLKEELRKCRSLILAAADKHHVPAGGALAVDREAFSREVTNAVKSHPLITVKGHCADEIPPEGIVIIATGPLTCGALAESIQGFFGGTEYLSFYDAAAPLVEADSIDMDFAYLGSRYGRGEDYINCPMTRDEFEAFRQELYEAKEAEVRGFEDKRVFEGCMPVEVMARRGADTLRFGSMYPIGLRDPRTGQGAYAVAQLRRDNAAGTLYNMVGFQTHLTFPEQRRVFSMIPALHKAAFARYGVMHRNSFLRSPELLTQSYEARRDRRVFFAGQITGVEGYIESISSGLCAGIHAARRVSGLPELTIPPECAIGALAAYISNPAATDFQPMKINYSLLPKLQNAPKAKQEKNRAVSLAALAALEGILPELLRDTDYIRE